MKKVLAFVCLAAAGLALISCAPTKNGREVNPSGEDPSDDEKGAAITFAAGDGAFSGGAKSVAVNADSKGIVTIDASPVLDGHAFSGWYSGDVKFDPTSAYNEPCTFTARYESGSGMNVYSALFDEGSTVEVKINMSDSEWKKLNNDYVVFNKDGRKGKSPIYRMASSVVIGVNGLNYYYEEVGVRMKGNTSRHEFYDDNGFNDLVHFKLSFKQTFDDTADGYTENELKVWTDDNAKKARKNRLFGDMENIDLKFNSTKDETYVREPYAMKLFRENGIAGPT